MEKRGTAVTAEQARVIATTLGQVMDSNRRLWTTAEPLVAMIGGRAGRGARPRFLAAGAHSTGTVVAAI